MGKSQHCKKLAGPVFDSIWIDSISSVVSYSHDLKHIQKVSLGCPSPVNHVNGAEVMLHAKLANVTESSAKHTYNKYEYVIQCRLTPLIPSICSFTLCFVY